MENIETKKLSKSGVIERDNVKNVFSARVQKLLLNRNMTPAKLAESLNVSQRAIEYYILKKRLPKVDIVLAIADFFVVPIDYLIREEFRTNIYSEHIISELLNIKSAADVNEIRNTPYNDSSLFFDATDEDLDDLKYHLEQLVGSRLYHKTVKSICEKYCQNRKTMKIKYGL